MRVQFMQHVKVQGTMFSAGDVVDLDQLPAGSRESLARQGQIYEHVEGGQPKPITRLPSHSAQQVPLGSLMVSPPAVPTSLGQQMGASVTQHGQEGVQNAPGSTGSPQKDLRAASAEIERLRKRIALLEQEKIGFEQRIRKMDDDYRAGSDVLRHENESLRKQIGTHGAGKPDLTEAQKAGTGGPVPGEGQTASPGNVKTSPPPAEPRGKNR